ncbi:MAG: PAS domain-containing protein [Proteobacteria bacterium]|nr:PAS domain-containing protein [Pseudomonadota bacterium]
MAIKKKKSTKALLKTPVLATKQTRKRAQKSEAPQPPAEKAAAGFPIIGIGASAGGLVAFEAFFSAIPEDTEPGMAYVLVQHLAPDHKSILADLIQSYTHMQVFEVVDGMTVQVNCVYIIPPGRDMAFLGGRLQLLEPVSPRGHRQSIDFFFRSLAQDQHARAICIVLSGTGSDGTEGLRAVKGAGGMIMVQRPDSAEFNGMPLSAIGTGLADYQLLPAEMPAQILAYTASAFNPTLAASGRGTQDEKALQQIFILLRDQTGHDFSKYKPGTIHRRIERRLAAHHLQTLDKYLKHLQKNPAETEALFRDLLIGVTSFFRDPLAFKALEERVIPGLFAGKPADGVIRVWTPGCSTGEEAYSLAILLHEGLERFKTNLKVLIFATDIDSQAIATARIGTYPAKIADNITPERLARFFTLEPDGNTYRIHKNIRELLIFSEQNVIKDPPFSKLDLISCRNLLIYMSGNLQKKLIPIFHYALNPGGFLFLGSSETVSDLSHIFITLDGKLKLYSRAADVHGAQHTSFGRYISPLAPRHKGLPLGAGRSINTGKLSLRELTEQALLRQVAPTGALVKSNGDILYLHGRTGMYLEPAQGEIGVNNILGMAREGLRRELTAALNKAVTGRKTVSHSGLLVKTNGNFTPVNLTICPLTSRPVSVCDPQDRNAESGDSAASMLFLVILEEALSFNVNNGQHAVPVDGDEEAPGAGNSEGPRENARIATLRQELWAQEQYLQTANEEFKSTNEEMQSVNEELQSTNEELVTSREEMQSINEELATVNSELQSKVADLSRANNDMNNLLSGTGIATIFLDNDLHILRFTPNATGIINLILTDLGRPLSHIVSNLVGYERLAADTRAVLNTLVPKEIEVQANEGSWYILRIRPYRTVDNVIEGVVLTFVDITATKRAQEVLLKANDLLRLAVAKRDTDDVRTLHNLDPNLEPSDN